MPATPTTPIPETPDQLRGVLLQLALMQGYARITLEARRKRLTEHDISLIERDILAGLRGALAAAEEFTTFEAEPAIAKGIADVREAFERFRQGRAEKI